MNDLDEETPVAIPGDPTASMAAPQLLTVNYLAKDGGTLETDRRQGHNFRWDRSGASLDVRELDADGRVLWGKSYANAPVAELAAAGVEVETDG